MLAQYYHISQAIGIAVHIAADDTCRISCCQVLTDQKQLTIEKKVQEVDNIAGLQKQLDTKIPVALNLSGKGVLIKHYTWDVEDEPVDISRVLPGVNSNDFYIQDFSSGELRFAALIRKSLADHWISLLQEQGFKVLALSLGPFPVIHIANQLNVYEGDLLFDATRISRNPASDWTEIAYGADHQAPFILKLGQETISPQMLLPYAAAFQLTMAARLEQVEAGVPTLETAFGETLAVKKLKVNFALALVGFFVLLLLNMILLSWLNAGNKKLYDQVSQSSSSASDMEVLTAGIKDKESLLNEMGWDGGINKAKLADQLAALLPAEVMLKEMAINPPDESNNRSRQKLSFLDHRIKISGQALRIIEANEWMARIKTLKWVKGVQLENYSFDNELNTGKFTIMIKY